MNIILTTTEIADLRSCYFRYTKQRGNTTSAAEEEDIIVGILHLFPAYPSDPDEQHTLYLTPTLWRTLREALIAEIPLWEIVNAHIIASTRRSLLRKLDTLTLIAYVEEAVESETTT